MKLGSENRKELIAAIILAVLAVGLLARWLFSSGETSSASATPPPAVAVTQNAVLHHGTPGRKVIVAERSLDPRLRLDLLKDTESTLYEGKGRNIFRAEAEIPKPIASAMHKPKFIPPPPMPEQQGPPPPPPINLKFYGFASRPGEPKKVFLSQGDDVFIAGEGDIVDRRYKVLQITPTAVEVEDVLTNNRQSIPLTQG